MPLDSTRVRQCLKDFRFRQLFTEELGWDHQSNAVEVTVDGREFPLLAVAEKRGMVAFHCPGIDAEDIPSYVVRRKIERRLSKSVHEHIIIFTDENETTQIWQWVKREVGRPSACREHTYHRRQPGDALIQKLQALEFRLEEEETLTVVDVAGRARAAFDVDRVTKRFYDRFKTEHAALLAFIKGIPSQDDQAWYASLMLNRLMFVYFIQKKGFLDSDPDYLRNRLLAMQRQHGNDKFYSFYKHFLLRLFHEGLNQPIANRTGDLDALLGSVPYLNGGLFDLHRLEEQNPKIEIEDQAFQRLFDFFDGYQWHLDERPLRADNEINPDVLGYIFEKYINQKQMGAYYTKEDITGYIAQNTVVPFLFDAAQRKCPAAFKPGSSLWQLLADDPDRYIYPAVRHGVDTPLPNAIAAGLNNVAKRSDWNRAAPSEFALPTETWREHIARRTRCLDLRRRLAAGEVHSINDLITLNLNIRQFAQDAIENCETAELLRALYQAICSVSILDPTCGSGAFLFAALNVLEPLYEACLERMQAFVDELPAQGGNASGDDGTMNADHTARRSQPGMREAESVSVSYLVAEETAPDERGTSELDQPAPKRKRSKRFSDFRRALAEVAKHPSSRYFILKSIIIGNLYGVDIMEEAVEICKLRLFLKLVAQVEGVKHVEPLPDVDFNIRAGNTLVGYVSLDQIRQAIERERGGQKKLVFSDAKDEVSEIAEKAEIADRAYQRFREMQTIQGMDANHFVDAKRELRRKLDALEVELDSYLATEYGVSPRRRDGFNTWLRLHQPFHWFAEFFGIMHRGGFDVIIGNPPYVEYRAVRDIYAVRDYSTEDCGNLYAFVWERCLEVALTFAGRVGLIVPVASVCTSGYVPLQKLFRELGETTVANFNDRPSKLFDGLEHIRLSIILHRRDSSSRRTFSTAYNKWQSVERLSLFQRLSFVESTDLNLGGTMAKVGTPTEAFLLRKVNQQTETICDYFGDASPIYYTRKLSHFVQILDFVPRIWDAHGNEREPSELKEIRLKDDTARNVFLAVLNSTLFYWLLTAYSDCRNLNKREVCGVRFSLSSADSSIVQRLASLSRDLMADIVDKFRVLTMSYKRLGTLRIQCTYPRFSKDIIDQIDWTLAEHLQLSDEERDFIINYDIKYRMGQDSADDEG